MLSVDGNPEVGEVRTYATSGRGLNVEELADMALRKLIHIADTAPPDMREQAHQFKENIRVVLVKYLHQAIVSDRTTLSNKLRGAGQREAADIVLRI